jgi:hypothetical protein
MENGELRTESNRGATANQKLAISNQKFALHRIYIYGYFYARKSRLAVQGV